MDSVLSLEVLLPRQKNLLERKEGEEKKREEIVIWVELQKKGGGRRSYHVIH